MSKPPRSVNLRVRDILKSIEQIEQIINRVDFQTFCKDFIYPNTIIRDLEIIGEAAKFLPPHLTDLFPQIPWQDVRDMRNLLAHEYFGVNLLIVWTAATEELEDLKKVLLEMEKMLPEEG